MSCVKTPFTNRATAQRAIDKAAGGYRSRWNRDPKDIKREAYPCPHPQCKATGTYHIRYLDQIGHANTR